MKAHLLPRSFAALLPLVSGCASSNYQRAPASTPPSVLLNLRGTPNALLDATVETVITLNGPGSWKRHAFWDEYVLALTNNSRAPLRLTSAYLVNTHGERRTPGDNWEHLERQSASWVKRDLTLTNIGLTASQTALGAGGAFSVLMIVGGSAMGSVEAIGIGCAGLLVAMGAGYLSIQPSKDAELQIGSEFDRRRLDLPHTLSAHASIYGSLFFPITSSPHNLVVEYEQSGRSHRVSIDLTALGDLHPKK